MPDTRPSASALSDEQLMTLIKSVSPDAQRIPSGIRKIADAIYQYVFLSLSAPVNEPLGWAWERWHSNGGYTRKFCATEFEARELAKDGENLASRDLVYPFFALQPSTSPQAVVAQPVDAKDLMKMIADYGLAHLHIGYYGEDTVVGEAAYQTADILWAQLGSALHTKFQQNKDKK